MATINRTVELIFEGIDKTSKVATDISGRLGAVGDVAESIAAPLSRVADGVLAADAALAALAVGGLTLAVTQAGDFSDSIQEIGTLTDTTSGQLNDFSATVLQYARESTSSIEDLTGAIYTSVSAGVDLGNSVDFVRQAEMLATAGKADLQSTTLSLASTMNAYGASVDEVGRYSDAYFTVVRDGLTTLPELAGAMGNVTGIAATAGVPIETLGAAMAALTAAGNNTATSTTLLGQTILAILSPTPEAEAAFRELGVQFGETGLASRGLEGILADVAKATGGSAEALDRLFPNVRAFRGAAILAADDSGVFSKALKDMADNAGATATAYERMADNFGLVNQNLVNNVRATLIQVGVPLLDEYGSAVRALSGISAAVGIAVDQGSFRALEDALSQAAGQVTEFFEDVAAALPDALAGIDYGPLILALDRLGNSVLDFFGGMDLTTAEGLQAAIQGAVDTIASLVITTEGIGNAFKPIVTAIGVVIEEYNSLSAGQQAAFGENILGQAKLITLAGAEIAAALLILGNNQETFSRIVDGISGGLTAAVNGWQLVTGVLVDLALEQQIARIQNALNFSSLTDAEVTQFTVELERLQRKLAENQADLSQNSREATASVEKLFGAIGNVSTATPGASDGIGKVADASKRVTEEAAPAAVAIKAMGSAADGADMQAVGEEIAAMAGKVAAAVTPIAALAKAEADAANQSYEFTKGADGVWRNADAIAGAMPAATQEVVKASDALTTAAGDSDTLRLGMAKLATDLAATSYQANIDLQVAKVQADAKVIESVLSTLQSTFASSTTAISTLFGQLGGLAGKGGSSIFLQNQISQQLQTQQVQQAQAHQQTMALTQAQINALNARTALIQQGGGLIQIDGTGLAPALQMVMWEIIEEVQVRVNASAADFLLGVV